MSTFDRNTYEYSNVDNVKEVNVLDSIDNNRQCSQTAFALEPLKFKGVH